MRIAAVATVCLVACTGVIGAVAPDGAAPAVVDAAPPPPDSPPAVPDAAAQPECEWGGAPGMCLGASACAALGDHTLETGTCAATLGCCIVTPSVASNPPIPVGYRLMKQGDVTADMTAWAVAILHDHATYPMFATTTMAFGTLTVLARVEWHAPDFQNSIIHRGVTLYQPI